MSEFPDRVVLGGGYPWAWDEGPYTIGLNKKPTKIRAVFLNGPTVLHFPTVLESRSVPKYRLVLEKEEE